MATGAACVVRGNRDTVIVEDVLFAELLPAGRIQVLPGPVLGTLNLPCGFRMATQAGSCDLLRRRELTLQFLEFGMIGRRRQLHRLGIGSNRRSDATHAQHQRAEKRLPQRSTPHRPS